MCSLSGEGETKTYVFVEPHITGGDCTVEITEQQILKFMKKLAKRRKELKKLTDKQLIEQFVITHWATEKA